MRAPGERLVDAWAFGDNINDIPMLQAAGHGMAMINAEPEDRDAADAITEFDNDHDASPAPSWLPSPSSSNPAGQLIWDGAILATPHKRAAKIAPSQISCPSHSSRWGHSSRKSCKDCPQLPAEKERPQLPD